MIGREHHREEYGPQTFHPGFERVDWQSLVDRVRDVRQPKLFCLQPIGSKKLEPRVPRIACNHLEFAIF